MIDPASAIEVSSSAGGGVKANASPNLVQDFEALMNNPAPVPGTVVNFVQKAEGSLKATESKIESKLNDFGSSGQVMSLIDAMHQSSLRSVSVQLTSKVGTKVSEGFEQLVKQQ